MRKTIAFGSIPIVALLVGVVRPAHSQNTEKTNISEYCVSHNDFGLSHGACVAYFRTHNVAPHDASVCQDAGIQNFLGVTNHGQCMKKLSDVRK